MTTWMPLKYSAPSVAFKLTSELYIGPAVYARKLFEAKLGMLVQFEDVTVENNTNTPLENAKFRSLLESRCSAYMRSIHAVFKGSSSVSHNVGTGVYGTGSKF